MARDWRQAQPNYQSGEDFVLEFRSFRYGFNTLDFSQRVRRAALELGLVDDERLDEEGLVDLVRLVSTGTVGLPLSELGDYLVRMGDQILIRNGESLVYWLRELLFRGAWLDLQVMEEQIEVAFDEQRMEFVYYPAGHRSREIGLPPHPSWDDVAFRG